MPSLSKSQAHFFQMVRGLQSGKLSPSDLPVGIRAKVKKTAKTISPDSASEFAKTRTSELPDHIANESTVDLRTLTFLDFLDLEQTFVGSDE